MTTSPFLETPSERVVRHAVDEFLDGALKPDIEGELALETQASRYRFIDGVCFSASDDDFVGAELVGWLLESDRTSAVSAWWRRGARAVLLLRRARPEIVVTSPTSSLSADGKPARDGFATQQARFIADRGLPTNLTAIEDEVSIELDPDDEPGVRPSTPAEDPYETYGRPPMGSAPRFRLPTVPLPVAPEVANVLGPVTLPPVSMPQRRRAG